MRHLRVESDYLVELCIVALKRKISRSLLDRAIGRCSQHTMPQAVSHIPTIEFLSGRTLEQSEYVCNRVVGIRS